MLKTNVMRILDQAKIPYLPHEYEVDENDLSGEHTAARLGIDPARLFKTLAAKGERGLGIFCIPCDRSLDLKKAAKALKEKKVEMLHVRDLKNATGYIRGGCSPVGLKKPYPVFVDETCVLFDRICVSAGARGFMVELEPDALCRLVNAQTPDLVKDDPSANAE